MINKDKQCRISPYLSHSLLSHGNEIMWRVCFDCSKSIDMSKFALFAPAYWAWTPPSSINIQPSPQLYPFFFILSSSPSTRPYWIDASANTLIALWKLGSSSTALAIIRDLHCTSRSRVLFIVRKFNPHSFTLSALADSFISSGPWFAQFLIAYSISEPYFHWARVPRAMTRRRFQ